MKRFAIATLLLIATTPAFAADEKKPEPPKITCGKTLEECQKLVDDLTSRLAMTTLGYNAARTQRDQNASAAADQQIQAYIQQQAAEAAKIPTSAPSPAKP